MSYTTVKLDTLAKLSILYSEPHRRYHNLTHIHRSVAMLEEYYEDEKNVTQSMASDHWESLAMIWFHDAVYNPFLKPGVNELHSADLWETFAEDNNIPGHHKDVVYDGIMASARHTEDQTGLTVAQKIFLDIDLHGMGSNWHEFIDNGFAIRDEYSHVPDKAFLEGRTKFMEKMANRENIFYTQFFRDRYEKQARENIKDWLASKGLF